MTSGKVENWWHNVIIKLVSALGEFLVRNTNKKTKTWQEEGPTVAQQPSMPEQKEERGCMLAVMGQWLNSQTMKQTPRITCNGTN